MLNVSWATKRAEFVFVFAIGDTAKRGERVKQGTIMERYEGMKIRNNRMCVCGGDTVKGKGEEEEGGSVKGE